MRKTLLLPLFLYASLAAADGLPDLGDISQEMITPQMERQIGLQSMFQIRASKNYLDDPVISDYLNSLGSHLILNSSEPGQTFEFFALEDNAINAFALPGGFIGVNTGLITLAQNESELASVLSHEISHVTQHHLARLVSGQKYDSLAAMAAMAVAILAARNSPQMTSAAIVGAQGGVMQRQLNFTREHEREADRIGLSILEKSGFDSRGMPTFFSRLQKATQLVEGDAPSYLRTHPLTTERIADVDNRVQQIPFRLVPDSLDFQLIRTRLSAMQKTPAEAVTYFTAALTTKKFGNPIAQRYGLALSLLRDQQIEQAAKAFAPLAKLQPANPILETLHGQIVRAENNGKQTSAFYQAALQRFPHYAALIYDYSEALLQDEQYPVALKLLDEQMQRNGNDPKLYDLQARAYAALGRHQEKHHALSYFHILHGNLYGAIEQLELAKRAGNDYYQLSTIESELRQYREIAEAQRKKR